MALTDTGIRALKPRKTRYIVTDGRGLCLEVLPTGKLSWLYRYRLKGRPERVVIARYPDLSLKAARNERDTLAGLVSRGQSPAREKVLRAQPLSAIFFALPAPLRNGESCGKVVSHLDPILKIYSAIVLVR